MALESATKISQLVSTNPTSTDVVSQGDNHLRMIKSVLKSSFPSDVSVQIPDIADAGADHYLTTNGDGTAIEWAEFPDITELLTKPGEANRSKFEKSDANKLRINPCGYHVSGKGYINIDSELEIDVTDGGWNYIYIDASEISPASTFARLAITETAIYASTTAPTYSSGVTKRGWYNGEDRCIFTVWVDAGEIRDFDHNNDYVFFHEEIVNVASTNASGWVAYPVTIPPLGSIHGQFTFEGHAPGETGIYGSSFRMRHNDGNGQSLGRAEGGNHDRDEDHTISKVRQMSYVEDGAAKIQVSKTTGDPTNTYSLATNGFYLPHGM